ncbi:hypothetical protein IIA15_05150 [candidate division TA06 bacterium]|nr:hypothetical protein [candidate division TA06 bacterium]
MKTPHQEGGKMEVEGRVSQKIPSIVDLDYLKLNHKEGIDFFLLIAHSKKDASEIACLKFTRKYGMDYPNLIQKVDEKRRKGTFDMKYFEMSDDLMDWEFAEIARNWWGKKIEKMSACFC